MSPPRRRKGPRDALRTGAPHNCVQINGSGARVDSQSAALWGQLAYSLFKPAKRPPRVASFAFGGRAYAIARARGCYLDASGLPLEQIMSTVVVFGGGGVLGRRLVDRLTAD